MNEIITEKKYPIQGLWVLKSNLVWGLFFIFFSSGSFFRFSFRFSEIRDADIIIQGIILDVFIIIFVSFPFIVTALRRANFHYSIEGQFITLRQGILSKQQRHIPYGVIQNLFVKQDLFDRLFGLASLTIENASLGAGALATPQEQKVFGLRIGNLRKQQVEMVGFSGNKISIPGLAKQNAETLKEIVMQKIRENPIEDSQSGLWNSLGGASVSMTLNSAAVFNFSR